MAGEVGRRCDRVKGTRPAVASRRRRRALADQLTAILARRGIVETKELESYLTPTLGALHDPRLMADMETATARLLDGLAERVVQRSEPLFDLSKDDFLTPFLTSFFAAQPLDAGHVLHLRLLLEIVDTLGESSSQCPKSLRRERLHRAAQVPTWITTCRRPRWRRRTYVVASVRSTRCTERVKGSPVAGCITRF